MFSLMTIDLSERQEFLIDPEALGLVMGKPTLDTLLHPE